MPYPAESCGHVVHLPIWILASVVDDLAILDMTFPVQRAKLRRSESFEHIDQRPHDFAVADDNRRITVAFATQFIEHQIEPHFEIGEGFAGGRSPVEAVLAALFKLLRVLECPFARKTSEASHIALAEPALDGPRCFWESEETSGLYGPHIGGDIEAPIRDWAVFPKPSSGSLGLAATLLGEAPV